MEFVQDAYISLIMRNANAQNALKLLWLVQ